MEALILSGLAFGGYHIINNSNNENTENNSREKYEKTENIQSIFNNMNSDEKTKIVESLSEILHNKSKESNSNIILKDGLFKMHNKNEQIDKNENEHNAYLKSLNKFNSLLPENLKKEESKYLDKYFAKIGYEKDCDKNINSKCNNDSWENMFGSEEVKEHNNMVPFFGSHIRENIDHNEFNSRKVNNYSTKTGYKREQSNFSDAFNNKQNVNGAKNNMGERQYYINSNLKQGEKPFEEIKVGPGLGISSGDIHNNRGFHDSFRYLGKTVNELRTKNNPKITYKGKVKIGKSTVDKSQLKSNLMKNKPDKFREMQYDDWFKTTGQFLKDTFYGKIEEKPKKHQSIKEHYGQVRGLPKSKVPERFRKSFKSEQQNNHTGNIKAFNKETNHMSDNAKTTIKETTLYEPHTFMSSKEKRYAEFEDTANTTIRETTEVNEHNGNINGFDKQTQQYSDKLRITGRQTIEDNEHTGFVDGYDRPTNQYTDNAKTTLKQTTEVNNHMGNIKNYVKNVVNYVDNAKNTIRQTTENNQHNGNIQAYIKETMQFIDSAKNTLKQTTEQNSHNGYILNMLKPAMQYIDDARTTIRELTENNSHSGNIDTYNKSTNPYTDELRTTVRQTTENNDYTGNLSAYEKHTNHLNDDMKTTMKETTVEYTRDGNVGTYKKHMKELDDNMKTTLKETTVEYTRDGPITGHKKQQTQLFDNAKTTLKEVTEDNIYHSGVKGYNKPKEYQQDDARQTYKEQTSDHEYIPIADGLDRETNQDAYRNADTNELKEIISQGRDNSYQGPKQNVNPETINIEINRQQLDDLPIQRGKSNTTNQIKFDMGESNKNLYTNVCRLDTTVLDSLRMNPLNVRKIYDNGHDCK